MANSNLPGYMELKVESFDGDAGTGELNLSYNEIEKYFLLADGQLFIRVPSDFPIFAGIRAQITAVSSNEIVIGEADPTTLYMTGGSSKAFSLTEPTP